jgi:hypothetical protein
MAAPRDPRDRLPPFLARYCPDSEIVKQQSRLWAAKFLSFLYRWLTRFGKACARGWWALDWGPAGCSSFAPSALLCSS